MRTNENSSRPPRSTDGERRTRRPSSDRPNREHTGERSYDRDARPNRDRGGSEYNRDSNSERPNRDRNSDRNFSPRGEHSKEGVSEARPPRSFDKNDRPIYGDREDRGERSDRRSSERPSYPRRDDSPRGERPERSNSERPSYPRRDDKPRGERGERPERRNSERPSYPRREDSPRGERGERPERPERRNSERPSYPRREDSPRGERGERPERRNSERPSYPRREDSPRGERSERPERRSFDRSSDRPYRERSTASFRDQPSYTDRSRSLRKNNGTNPDKHRENASQREDGFVRLNKYIANAGICSRREADTLISSGAIKVNGEVCTALGTMVGPEDKIQFGDQSLKKEKKVYLLMNKPKEYITTSDDPQERKTVMHLIAGACKERIYPVGRLDRNTTGVLLFTNDGEVAKKLTHPAHGARKIYHVTLDKAITKTDLTQIADGLQLDDGFIEVDEVSLISPDSKKEVGIQIHSGRNRIVRRIFEHLGYAVTKLDRVLFAELTKKELSRGQWRMLTDKEVSFLRMNV